MCRLGKSHAADHETGRLRWRTVDGGILAARKVRDDLGARRARGESIAPRTKLRFGQAADAWLSGPVLDLRETTQSKYRCIVNEHVRPRFEARHLDAVTADDLALLVRDLRADGKSEATIAAVLSVVGRVYKFAARRLGWSGTIPNTLLLHSERPKVSLAKRRRSSRASSSSRQSLPLKNRFGRCSRSPP